MYIRYWALQHFSQDYFLALPISHVLGIDLRWQDLQFNLKIKSIASYQNLC